MFRPDGGWLFLASPRKSHQKERDPRVTRPASPAALRYSCGRAAAELGPFGPQTVLADCPRPPSVARRCTGGGKAHRTESIPTAVDIGVVFIWPFASSSSARRNGKKGEDCLRTEGPSSAAPRCGWAAQRPRRSRATRQARNPAFQNPLPQSPQFHFAWN